MKRPYEVGMAAALASGTMATVRGPGVMRTEVSSTPRPLAGEGLLPLHHYLFPSLPQGRREGGWESTGTPGGGEPESGSERTGRGLSQNAPWDQQADGWQMVLSLPSRIKGTCSWSLCWGGRC